MGIAGIGDAPDEDGEIRVGEEGGDRLGDDETDDPGAPGGQTAGGGMGLITGLPDDLPDPFPHLRAHIGVLVDHPGDGGTGYARQFGDFFQGRRHGPPFWERSQNYPKKRPLNILFPPIWRLFLGALSK
jgi:hypothetical protein